MNSKHERMKRQTLLATFRLTIFCFLISLVPLSAQTNTAMTPPSDSSFQKAWKDVDSLGYEGLFQSALERIAEIREQATAAERPDQLVRAIIYRAFFSGQLDEDDQLATLRQLMDELEETSGIELAMLRSATAELLFNYRKMRTWRNSARTEVNDRDTADIAEWSLERLDREVTRLYINSLLPAADLRSVPIDDLSGLIDPGEMVTGLRPTLYDVLVHRALDHFSDARSFLTEAAPALFLQEAALFADNDTFVGTSFQRPPQEGSPTYSALQLFQELTAWRVAQNEETAALIDLTLRRLEFARAQSSRSDADTLYRQALEGLISKYSDATGIGLAYYQLAELWQNSGRSYDPSLGDAHRYDLVKAREIAQECISKLPDTYGSRRCAGLIKSIERPELEVQIEEVLLPEESILMRVDFRNLADMHVRVLRFTEKQYKEFAQTYGEERTTLITSMEEVNRQQLSLPTTDDYQRHATELLVDGLPPGQYLLQFALDSSFPMANQRTTGLIPFQVSSIAFLQRSQPDGPMEFSIVHRHSGQPLEGAEVQFLSSENRRPWRKLSETSSNAAGLVTTKLERASYLLRIQVGEDVLFSSDRYYDRRYNNQEPDREFVSFFLDRTLYRPGQTIYFKGIALRQKGTDAPEISSDRRFTIALVDANYQEVSEQSYTTNDYGTFNGTFKAPSGGLNGRMQLRVKDGDGSAYFQVEEYKRPTFEVSIDSLPDAYQLGDTVALTGLAETYSGSALSQQTFEYRVERRARIPWWMYYRRGISPTVNQSIQIARGEGVTDDEGRFLLEFPALPDASIDRDLNPSFYYEVTVTVTDLTGETHEAAKRIRLGYEPFSFEVTWAADLDLSDLEAPAFSVTNSEGGKLSATIEYQLIRLDAPGQLFRKRYWERPDLWQLSEADYREQVPFYAYQGQDDPRNWARLDSSASESLSYPNSGQVDWSEWIGEAGHYEFVATARRADGSSVTRRLFVSVADPADKSLPDGMVWWQGLSDRRAEPGDTIRQMVGSQGMDQILMEIERKGEIIQSGWLDATNWTSQTYELVEADRGNVFVHLSGLFNNRPFTQSQIIEVPWTNKKLNITYETFRDKLRPGTEEEWRIRISGPEQEAVAAELVATMYDASLDAIRPHDWNWAVYNQRTYAQRSWYASMFNASSDRILFPFESGPPVGRRTYPSLQWPERMRNYPTEYGAVQRMTMSARSAESDAMASPMSPPPPPAVEEMVVAGNQEMRKAGNDQPSEPDSIEGQADPSAEPAPASIRRNLKETVFFMPELRTDENGEVIISFTMNEALTRWKFMGLAHTKDLKYALTTQEIITQKELMVQPNPPRFVREGDALVYTARVANLTDAPLAGTAELELFDAATGESLNRAFGVNAAEQAVQIDAKGNALVSWSLDVPTGITNALTHRVFVRAGDFSDGEESTLPVLTNRMMVTETIPFFVRPGKEVSVTMPSLNDPSETVRPHQLTLEYTANPAWLAVKAMPYLMEYPHECAEQQFSRYYANALAGSLVADYPRIQEVFAKWREQGGLKSNLVQNEDLKSALIAETPWVLDALSEEEQRRNIALLFDMDRLAQEQENALSSLKEMQLGSGGFPWFAGGPDNWYITQYLVAGMGHLRALGISPEKALTETSMTGRAIQYLDTRLIDAYDRMLAAEKEGTLKMDEDHLSSLIIHYLYARSFYTEMLVTEDLGPALSYFQGQAEKYWSQRSVYEQGMIGLASLRVNKAKLAERIRASLKERELRTSDRGTCWRYSEGYRWMERPLEIHALLMEFFASWEEEEELIDEMKLWLLRHKQTNSWETTKATANAIYALLKTNGATWIEEGTPQASIIFPKGKKKDYLPKVNAAQQAAEAGTGTWKATWEKEEVTTDFATVRVENQGEEVGWGGLYWQYFEDLDQIETFRETPLTLEKGLYRKVYDDRGANLVAVGDNESLEPGTELVVRLRLEVDRPMEYIHLKDMRASGLEPGLALSGYRYQDGLGYYESTTDVATHFFMDYLPRGVYVLEYSLRVTHSGSFSNGISSIQSMYAPEFSSHSEGRRIKINPQQN